MMDVFCGQIQIRCGDKMIAFISGHLDLTESEFKEHYVPLIDQAVDQGHRFVVGDARGTDAMAQMYLKYSPHTTVYHMFESPRNNVGDFQTVGGFKTDAERDVAMTAASDYDIAWVREGRENSGTAKNIKRRKSC